MREGCPNNISAIDPPTGLEPERKSLFRNILPANPYGSRFYPYPSRSAIHNSLRMKILEEQEKKVLSGHGPRSEPKSLFQKILRVSPYASRFWRAQAASVPRKPLRMNILEILRGKIERPLSKPAAELGFRCTPRTDRVV